MHACTSFVLIVLAFGMATGYDSPGQDDLDGTLAELGKRSKVKVKQKVGSGNVQKGANYTI